MNRDDLKQMLQHRLVTTSPDPWSGVPASALRAALVQHAAALSTEGHLFPPDAVEWAIRHIIDEVGVFGPLHVLIHDGTITEIMVNGYDRVFIERDGHNLASPVKLGSEAALRRIIEGILALEPGRRLDTASPFVDVSGPDGARINIAIPPVVVGGPHLTIRKFQGDLRELDDLVALGALDERMAAFLEACVRSRLNVLFSGAASSGKTTLLERLAAKIPADERIIVVEDTAELRFPQPNVVRLLTRSANIEDRGGIAIRDLMRNALRMSPSRILVGEIRGAEALEYLQALSSGHRGSLAIVHAASPEEALVRVENLARYSGLDVPSSTLRRQIALGIDLVVQVEHLADGSRKVVRISEVLRDDVASGVGVRDLFRFEAEGFTAGAIVGQFVATSDLESFRRHFRRQGVEDATPAPSGLARKLTERLSAAPPS